MAEIDLEAVDDGGGRECVHPVPRGGSFGHTGGWRCTFGAESVPQVINALSFRNLNVTAIACVSIFLPYLAFAISTGPADFSLPVCHVTQSTRAVTLVTGYVALCAGQRGLLVIEGAEFLNCLISLFVLISMCAIHN